MKVLGASNWMLPLVCLPLLGLAISGCGGSDLPDLGEVEGTVTLDSTPLDGAMVYFSPEAGGRTSMSITDASGHYVLEFNSTEPGAVVGGHKVTITTFEEPTEEDDGTTSGGSPERVPAKYNTETTLVEEVKAGKQTIDFTLTSN